MGLVWNKFHHRVDVLFKEVKERNWRDHIMSMDHTAILLIEKISSSGCYLDIAKFREPLIQSVLDILSGFDIPEAEEGAIDTLVNALDSCFFADIWRTIREKIADVTPNSLDKAVYLFPQLLSNLVQPGDRITKDEKDNVIRHILCPALEGRNRAVLEIFVGVGYRRIADFLKSANDSTKERFEGAWKSFSETENDRDWLRTVGEAVLGKRQIKYFWEAFFAS